jgi:transposase-like protein
MWRRWWEQMIPFFPYPPEICSIIYTTNAIASLHMRLRNIVKNRGHFPSDEAATKLLYLALRNIEKDQKMPRIWKIAANQFAILFGERLTNAINYYEPRPGTQISDSSLQRLVPIWHIAA